MGRKKHKFAHYHYKKFIKSNLKWFLGIFGLVLFIAIILTPPQTFIDSIEWYMHFPPLFWFYLVLPAMFFIIPVAIISRGIYHIIKGKAYID